MRRGVLPFLLFALGGAALPAPEPALAAFAQERRNLRVVTQGDTATLAVHRLDGVEMVSLAEIAEAVGGAVRPGTGERQVVLWIGGQEIRFEAGRSFVDVGGTTRVLREPGVRRGGSWFVPLDFVARVLPDVIPGGTRYNRRTRTLLVGDEFPRLEVEIVPRPGATRVTVTTSPPLPMRLDQVADRYLISIAAPFLETVFPGAAPADGVVERVSLSRVEGSYLLEVSTGRNLGRLRQERGPGRFSLEFIRAGVRAESGASEIRARPGRGPGPLPDPVRPGPREVRTVAIDAGHGGADAGVTAVAGIAGPAGTTEPAGSSEATGTTEPAGIVEKDVALAVALALRDRLVNDHGVEVVMIRTTDRALGLDDRAVVANAARADLLISIHLNASPSPEASGSRIYYLSPAVSDRGGAAGAVHFVPWHLAQAEFVPESRRLAEAIAAEFESIEIPSGGVAHAPLRLLGGAAMPAVHVELGFVTSETDRELLLRPEFHGTLGEALALGILRYRTAGAVVRSTSRDDGEPQR